jgi:predicted dehydrogenase
VPNKTRWAIVGSGFISNTMVTAIRSTGRSEIVAITGRDSGRVEAFRSAHDIALGTTDVTQTVTSREIDAIYVATPNHAHHPVVIVAAGAGKAVVSEKSLTRDDTTARELADAVRAGGAFFVEGLMYLSHPLYRTVFDLLGSGELGELRSVSGYYNADIQAVANPAGGGTIYNLGCYPASLLHLVVQTMCGDDVFADREVTAVGNRRNVEGFDNVVDTAIAVRFGNGVLANLQSSDTHGMNHGFDLVTNLGTLRWAANPWLPIAGQNRLEWSDHDGNSREIVVADEHDAFHHQVRLVEDGLAGNATEAARPSPRLADSLEIMHLLCDWEAAIV